MNAIPHVGEAAALLVALLWSVGSLLFAWTTRRIGAHATNVLRITIAAVLLAAAATFTSGSPIPPGVRPQALAALALSGVIGLVAADYAYFRALLLMGPRRATLVAALAPVFTAAIGWAFLGEKLGRRGLLGIAVTLAGIGWVVLEQSPRLGGEERTLEGALFGCVYAFGQALALVLAKGAMTGLDTLSVASLRLDAAALVCWLPIVAGRGGFVRGARALIRPLRDRRVLAALGGATLVGPICGMSLSMFAVRHTETAVAATLMALVPILVIPLVVVVHRERPSARAVAGALVAVAGVAILMSRG